MGNIINAAGRFEKQNQKSKLDVIKSKIEDKAEILQKAWTLIESGQEEQIPEGELEELKQLGPGFERVVRGRIENIESSKKPEDTKIIQAYQKLLGTISKINNHFSNLETSKTTIAEVEETPTPVVQETAPQIDAETQQIIEKYQQYLSTNPEDYVSEGEYGDKVRNVEEIIEWLKSNKDKVPSTQSEIADQALLKFQNFLYQFKKEQRKKFYLEVDTINNSYLAYAREIADIKENVDNLIKRFNDNYKDFSYFNSRGRSQDSNEYERNQNIILTQILEYVQNYANKYRGGLKEDLAIKIEASNKIPEELRGDITLHTYGFNEDFIKETMSNIERRISLSMQDFNNPRVVDPYAARRINSKLEEISETLRIFRN